MVALWMSIVMSLSHVSPRILPQTSFALLSPIVWANFDGGHYLTIAKLGYGWGQQAFFPMYPLAIYFFKDIVFGPLYPREVVGMLISYISLGFALFFFYKIIRFDFSISVALWSIAGLLLFPSSFFFLSVYTESFFLAFLFASIYFMRRNLYFPAAFFAGIASGTRFIGIFLSVMLFIEYVRANRHSFSLKKGFLLSILLLLSISGFLGYAGYLFITYHDPLLFVHVQSAFGANRTNGSIVLLPQVIFRYLKIMIHPQINITYGVALMEFFSFCLFFIPLFFWKHIRLSYLIFSYAAIILPTLTGTLSSMPRYVLVIFPVFILFGSIKHAWIKILLLTISFCLLCVCTVLFLRGYFIA